MKKFQFILIIIPLLLSGCASVPRQIVDAMELQKKEISNIKQTYFENLYNQLDAIEKYRLVILDLYEEQVIKELTHALENKEDENGDAVYTLIQPTAHSTDLIVFVDQLKPIEKYFENKRDSVRIDIAKRREDIRLAERNFENIEQINSIVNEYLESLVMLKESQDRLAISLRNKLKQFVPVSFSINKIPDPSTIEDMINIIKPKNKPYGTDRSTTSSASSN